jgi:hypothetical protein
LPDPLNEDEVNLELAWSADERVTTGFSMLSILIYVGVCALVGWFGSNRRFGFWGYFLFSILFTPLVGLVLVIAFDKAKPSSRLSKIVWELEELRSYIAKFESAGLTPAETRELAGRLAAIQRSVMSNK